jgi:hypothetical protein
MKKIWVTLVLIALIVFSACKKENAHKGGFPIPCYHLSVTKPVAYISAGDTVIYSYDSLNRLVSAYKINSHIGHQYIYNAGSSIYMNELPLNGNTYSPAEYQIALGYGGVVDYFLNEVTSYNAQTHVNSNGLLDSVVWSYAELYGHAQYGAYDSAVYDANYNLISINTYYTEVQTHYTTSGQSQINMTYYDNPYISFDPEKEILAISDNSFDPQVFSKSLLASVNGNHYTYTLNNAGLIKAITDSNATSVVTKYIYYDCE